MGQQNYQQNSSVGKLPPQDTELEDVILGSIMLETEAIERVENILTVDCFYKPNNQLIYKAISDLSRLRKPIDMMTVREQLLKNGDEETVGGGFVLAQLTNKVASTAHLKEHSLIILEKYIRRQLIIKQSEIQNAAYDESADLQDVLSQANKLIEKVNDIAAGDGDSQHIRDITRRCIDSLEERTRRTQNGESIGVPTGFADLDIATNGWQPGELIVYAARPAMGKTAVMLRHALGAAEEKASVCIYSLEMTSMSLTDRVIQAVADVDSDRYKKGALSPEEWQRVENAQHILEDRSIYVDDNPAVSMKYIRSHVRKMKKVNKCDIVMIDYLQLVEMDGGYNQSRENQVAQASRTAKLIAKEFNIPVILLAQLSRDVEKRGGDKRPQLSDLRESGAIEQDADMVIFIHRPEYYGMVEDSSGADLRGVGKLIIAKFRSGGCQDVKFRYNEAMTRFYSYNDIGRGF